MFNNLNNFRKKLNSVISDGRTSLLSETYNRQQSAPSSLAAENASTSDGVAINFQAGCAMLDQQMEIWQDMHQLNVENAEAAVEIDLMIEKLKTNSRDALDTMNDFNSLLASLPIIVETLSQCTKMATELKESCHQITKELFELEDLKETVELQGQRLDHQYEMVMYKEKKLVELDQYRKELVDSHAGRVRDYENKLKQAQLERQAVFQEAFQHDMNEYKTHGTLPKVDLPKLDKSEITLEEIVLDNNNGDNDELTEFLNN